MYDCCSLTFPIDARVFPHNCDNVSDSVLTDETPQATPSRAPEPVAPRGRLSGADGHVDAANPLTVHDTPGRCPAGCARAVRHPVAHHALDHPANGPPRTPSPLCCERINAETGAVVIGRHDFARLLGVAGTNSLPDSRELVELGQCRLRSSNCGTGRLVLDPSHPQPKVTLQKPSERFGVRLHWFRTYESGQFASCNCQCDTV